MLSLSGEKERHCRNNLFWGDISSQVSNPWLDPISKIKCAQLGPTKKKHCAFLIATHWMKLDFFFSVICRDQLCNGHALFGIFGASWTSVVIPFFDAHSQCIDFFLLLKQSQWSPDCFFCFGWVHPSFGTCSSKSARAGLPCTHLEENTPILSFAFFCQHKAFIKGMTTFSGVLSLGPDGLVDCLGGHSLGNLGRDIIGLCWLWLGLGIICLASLGIFRSLLGRNIIGEVVLHSLRTLLRHFGMLCSLGRDIVGGTGLGDWSVHYPGQCCCLQGYVFYCIFIYLWNNSIWNNLHSFTLMSFVLSTEANI